jgi:Protein of unknown function (DUF3108)
MPLAIASKRRVRLGAAMASCALAIALILAPAGASRAAAAAPAIPAARDSGAGRRHKRHKQPPKPRALPDDIKVPVYPPGPIPLRDGERLLYKAWWMGILAATARVELHRNRKDPSLWNAEIWIDSSPLVDILYKMRDYLRERIGVDSLQPIDMYIRQSENQRKDDYHVTFDRSAKLVTLKKTNSRGTSIKEFIATDPWGPLSGAIMALSQPLKPGDTLAFDVFSGTNRYVFDFHVDRRQRIRVPFGDFDAYRITPGVEYMSDGSMRDKARDTLVWVSADERHLPLRIQAAAFIGSVHADLVGVENGPRPNAPAKPPSPSGSPPRPTPSQAATPPSKAAPQHNRPAPQSQP